MNTISSRWKLQRPGDSGLNEDILPRFEPRFQQDLKDTSIQPSYKYKALYFFSHWVVSLGNRETVGLVVVLCLDKDRLDWIFWNCFAIFQNAQNRITRAVHHKRRLYVPTDRVLYTILKKNRMGLDFVQFISNDLFLVLSDIICPTITSHIRQFVTSEDMKEKGYGIWRWIFTMLVVPRAYFSALSNSLLWLDKSWEAAVLRF